MVIAKRRYPGSREQQLERNEVKPPGPSFAQVLFKTPREGSGSVFLLSHVSIKFAKLRHLMTILSSFSLLPQPPGCHSGGTGKSHGHLGNLGSNRLTGRYT